MFQKIWSGLTTAAFVVATFGLCAPGQANSSEQGDDGAQIKVSHPEAHSESSEVAPQAGAEFSSPDEAPLPSTIIESAASTVETPPSTEVSKVGEYQSQEITEVAETAIATLMTHSHSNRQATTVYLRGIPVITFLGSVLTQVRQPATSSQPATQSASLQSTAIAAASSNGVKLATPPELATDQAVVRKSTVLAHKLTDLMASDSWRAAAIAAQINQLHRDSVNAESIIVRWDGQQQRYVIRVGATDLLALSSSVILPDTTGNPAEDALQMTNRLRRLLGNAPPLQEIADRPARREVRLAFGPIRVRLSGIASWYGPGFHGNRSASGEVFNQNELTAAHRTLPFGTRVRVTNLRTGQAVVVRINDRGPFSRGRIIDLSAAAARAIGLMSTGVAPVNLEILSPSRTAYQP